MLKYVTGEELLQKILKRTPSAADRSSARWRSHEALGASPPAKLHGKRSTLRPSRTATRTGSLPLIGSHRARAVFASGYRQLSISSFLIAFSLGIWAGAALADSTVTAMKQNWRSDFEVT